MAHQNDSFIDEVSEELRRDRLFAAFRRYGWIGLALILVIVAGAGWREYSRTAARTEAQAYGDALLSAETAADPVAALTALPPGSFPARKAISGLLAAGRQMGTGDAAGAAATLEAVAADAATPEIERDLARLKWVLTGVPDAAARDAALADLAQPGRAFRLTALELQSLAKADAGDTAGAIAGLTALRAEQGVGPSQASRIADALLTLGAAPEAPATAPLPSPAP